MGNLEKGVWLLFEDGRIGESCFMNPEGLWCYVHDDMLIVLSNRNKEILVLIKFTIPADVKITIPWVRNCIALNEISNPFPSKLKMRVRLYDFRNTPMSSRFPEIDWNLPKGTTVFEEIKDG